MSKNMRILVIGDDEDHLILMRDLLRNIPWNNVDLNCMNTSSEGLLALTRPTTLTMHPDSAYLANAFIEGWLDKWQRNGWMSGKKPVKNQDLWVALLDAIKPHKVTWKRVKGHSTVALNNRCDLLATHERDIHAGRIAAGTPPPACTDTPSA